MQENTRAADSVDPSQFVSAVPLFIFSPCAVISPRSSVCSSEGALQQQTSWSLHQQATRAEHKHDERPGDNEAVCRVRGKPSGVWVCLHCERHRLRQGFTWDGSGRAEMKVAAKSSCDAQNPKACSYFLDWLISQLGMQSKTVHSQTVILRIPGFNAHTQCWSHRSAHEEGEKRNLVFVHFPAQKRAQLALRQVQRSTVSHFYWLLSRTFELLVWRGGGGGKLN